MAQSNSWPPWSPSHWSTRLSGGSWCFSDQWGNFWVWSSSHYLKTTPQLGLPVLFLIVMIPRWLIRDLGLLKSWVCTWEGLPMLFPLWVTIVRVVFGLYLQVCRQSIESSISSSPWSLVWHSRTSRGMPSSSHALLLPAEQTDHGPRPLNSISQKRLEDCLKVGMRLVIWVHEVDFGAIDMGVIFALAHLEI